MNEILTVLVHLESHRSKHNLFHFLFPFPNRLHFDDTIFASSFKWFYVSLSDITIRMESTDTLSASSCHGDENTERFQSSVYTGRRVSFNETAIYEQSKKNQEKGRRSGNIIGGVEWCGLLSVTI